ncbi:zinc knuckle protein [Diplocarpon rosae]|nr:zinc knuckle protein [Diplocarpon rosae]
MVDASEGHIELATSDTPEGETFATSDHAQEPTSTLLEPTELGLSPRDEDSMDSRTQLVGRKRNLEDPRDTEAYELNDVERPPKRLKDHRDLATAVEGVSAGICSSSRLLAPMESELGTSQEPKPPLVEKASDYQVLREERQSHAPGAESSGLFSLVSTVAQSSRAQDTVPQNPTVITVQGSRPGAVTRTWNAAVSSILRTSFGSKTQLPASNISSANSTGGRTVSFEDNNNVIEPFATSANLSQAPRSFQPFQKLSKEEESSLNGEEKRRCLEALFAHHRESSRTETAPAQRVDLQNSDNEDESSCTAMALPVNSHPVPTTGPRHFKKVQPMVLETFTSIERAQYDSDLRAFLHGHADERVDGRAQKRLKVTKAQRACAALLDPNYPSHGPADIQIVPSIASTGSDYFPSDGGEIHDFNDRSNPKGFDLRPRADTRLLDQGARAPFVRLASKDVKNLTDDERLKYNRAMYEDKIHRKVQKLYEIQQATQEAEKAISNGFPLSKDQQKIEDAMSQGRTFYPRRPHQPALYSKGTRKWTLPEAFDMDGKPFKLQDFMFNDFAPIFLKTFPDDWDFIKQKTLIGAYATYVKVFYSHMSPVKIFGDFLADARATATSPDAITVEQAKQIARSQMSNDPNSLQYSLSANGSSPNLPGETPTVDRGAVEVLVAAVATSEPPASNVPAGAIPAVKSWKEADVAMSGMDAARQKANLVDFDLSEVELFLQQRYYPSSDPAIPRCLACSKTGHVSLTCPDMKCKACRTRGIHSESTCPLKKRCSKCREPGHNKNACPEKLSLPRSEMSCDLCGSTDHIEISCHLVWRSFDPRPEEIVKVREIHINCYSCGSGDHFGPECGLHRGSLYSGNVTWSRSNLLKYIDPSSHVRALSAGKDFSIPPPTRTGGANDPITIDESDDEMLIRPPVQPHNAGKGSIQVKQPRPKKLKKPKKPKMANTESDAAASTAKPAKGKGKKPAKTMAAIFLEKQKKKAKRERKQHIKSLPEA